MKCHQQQGKQILRLPLEVSEVDLATQVLKKPDYTSEASMRNPVI